MPNDLSCPRCATPLPSGPADAAGQTAACPRCAAGAAATPPTSPPVAAEAPWWVASPPVPPPPPRGEAAPPVPPRDETPWWVAPPPSLPAEPPALAPARAVVAPLPRAGKGGAAIRAYLVAAGLLLAAGMGVGILYLADG